MLAASTIKATTLIALMMDAARTSETSVNFYILQGATLQKRVFFYIRRCENLKSHCESFIRS
jgi:hypothetical protein